MVLVGVSFFPHGAMILDPTKEGLPSSAIDLHHQCKEAAKVLIDLHPEIILLVTPHGLSSCSSLMIYQNSTFQGSAGWLGHWNEFCVECSNVEEDTIIDGLISHLQRGGVACEGIAAFSKGVTGPLAWGEAVPLWFHNELLTSSDSSGKTRVIVLSIPQRRLTETLSYSATEALQTGQILTKLCQDPSLLPSFAAKRVCLLVSGDLSHVHGCDPLTTLAIYQGHPSLGSDPALARAFDMHIVEQWAKKIFKADGDNSLLSREELAKSNYELLHSESVRENVVAAKLCGFAGLCMIQGCLEAMTEMMVTEEQRLRVQGKVFGYAAPTYYGMLVAAMRITV